MLFYVIIFFMKMADVEIYTDGACSQNPGCGGYGAILFYKDTLGNIHEKKLSRGFKITTNNRMELLAVIDSLKILKKPCRVKLYSDSKYVVDSINQKWLEGWVSKNWRLNTNNPVKNIDLWKKFIELRKMHDIEFIWVKGHAANKYNELCDKLAVAARNSSNLETDEGFEN